MDFHTLSRKDLQALCKRNRIPANTTNVAMADALQALQSVEGLSEILDSVMVQSPKTSQKSTARKSKVADQASPLPRSRRVSAKPPVMDDEEKKEVSEAPSLVNTRRRTSKKEESKSIVGTTGGRRTRQTVKKEVDSEMVRTEVRRTSRRVKGIKMSPLSKEEDEEKDVEAEKLEVEAEKKSDEKEQSDDLKADADRLKSEEEKEAEIVVLVSKGDGHVDENDLEEEKVEDQDSKEERVFAKATDPVEDRAVENNEEKEEEAIAEEKQDVVMENTAGYVDEALVENKEEDKPINEFKNEQGKEFELKTEQECAKIVIEEMNILVDAKYKDKEDIVVEGIVDHVEETLLENEEDEAVDGVAKQGETTDFNSGKETSAIVIEEMNISVDTKQENVMDNSVNHVGETLVENKEEKPIYEEAKQEETVDFKSEQKSIVDHVEEALEENKEEEVAISEETVDFNFEQKIVDHDDAMLAEHDEEEETVKEEAKQEETIDFKTEQVSIVDDVETTPAENEGEEEAIKEEANREMSVDFKTEQMSIVDDVETTPAENEGEEEAIKEEAKLEMSVDFKTEQMSIVDDVEATLAMNEGEEEVVDEEAKQEETTDFKTKQESIVEYVEETLVENKEEDEAMDDSIMENISGYVEQTVVENKDRAKIVIEELNISVDTKRIDENVEDSVASVEEKAAEEYHVVDTKRTLVNEDSPVKGLITSNCKIMSVKRNVGITEEVKNVEMATDDVNEVVVDNEKFSIQELSDKTGTDVSKKEIMELAENGLDFKLSSESSSNKENANLVSVQVKAKSNLVNYENMSLRKLKSAYREMVAMKSKGEEKRTALKAVNENCM